MHSTLQGPSTSQSTFLEKKILQITHEKYMVMTTSGQIL